jgi:pSer/pThr/pTyr-binding forkhead associated (FHA) protein
MAKQTPSKKTPPTDIPPIKVTVHEAEKKKVEYEFKKFFTIGRDDSCEVQILSMGISRKHAEVYFQKGRWWIKDLKSANGTFVKGEQISEIPLGKSTRVELGSGDARLVFSVSGTSGEAETVLEKPPSVTKYIQRYFVNKPPEEAGQHTRMIQGAFQEVQKKQRQKYFYIIGVIIIISIFITIYSVYQHNQFKKQKILAQEMFYSMKTLELELSKLENQAAQSGNEVMLKEIEQSRTRQVQMVRNYDRLLEELHFFERSRWDEKDRIIIQVARSFGECELSMPQEFLDEVNRYVKKWRTTDRLEEALLRAVSNNYPQTIAATMLKYNLSPQFFYLALQESDFRLQTVGPRTRFGIAKGIWQFIPATASRYGLKIGPLSGHRRYDPKDERFDLEKSTEAAARYIRDIYETEAQASGLLVIASYNWGERKVRELLRKMPLNPHDRNFWELLNLYKKEIPRETYNYVFYIISAAVICEDPALFGFGFDNPLEHIDSEPADSLLTQVY